MEKKINTNIDADTKEVVIREGGAVKIAEPVKVAHVGSLRAPFDFIERKILGIDSAVMGTLIPLALTEEGRIYNVKRSTLLVDQEGGKLTLILNEKDPYQDMITGTLEESEELQPFHINAEHFFGLTDLIRVVKQNKFLFVTATDQEDLLKNLMNFNAKVTTTFKNVKDSGGNSTEMIERAVEANKQAPKFTLNARLYKGYERKAIHVETCIDATSNQVRFYFESVDLYELLDKGKEEAIAEELEKFKAAFDCSSVRVS